MKIQATGKIRSAVSTTVAFAASLISTALFAAPGISDEALLQKGLQKGGLNFTDPSSQYTTKGCCYGVSSVWEGLYFAPGKLSGTMDLSHATGAIIWNKLYPNDPVTLPENVTLGDKTVPLLSPEATKAIAAKAQRAMYSNGHFRNGEYGNYETWMQGKGKDVVLRSQKELASKVDQKNCIQLTVLSFDGKSWEPLSAHQIVGRIDKENQLWILDPNNEKRTWTKANAAVENGYLTLRYDIQLSNGKTRQEMWGNVYHTPDYYVQDTSIWSH